MKTANKVISIGETTLHTWFERDRAHVELRSRLTDQTIIEWWDDAVSEAAEDGFLSPRDYHTSAYQYALEHGMLPARPIHYIAMSGSHGCLPDHCEIYETRDGAIEDLASLFGLGRRRIATLKRYGSLELGRRDGAEYCEVTQCDCDDPAVHSDSGKVS